MKRKDCKVYNACIKIAKAEEYAQQKIYKNHENLTLFHNFTNPYFLINGNFDKTILRSLPSSPNKNSTKKRAKIWNITTTRACLSLNKLCIKQATITESTETKKQGKATERK